MVNPSAALLWTIGTSAVCEDSTLFWLKLAVSKLVLTRRVRARDLETEIPNNRNLLCRENNCGREIKMPVDDRACNLMGSPVRDWGPCADFITWKLMVGSFLWFLNIGVQFQFPLFFRCSNKYSVIVFDRIKWCSNKKVKKVAAI